MGSSVASSRPPPPFDQASREAPPLQSSQGKSFPSPLSSTFCLYGKNTPTSSLLVLGIPMRHDFLRSPEKPSFLLKWLVSCR